MGEASDYSKIFDLAPNQEAIDKALDDAGIIGPGTVWFYVIMILVGSLISLAGGVGLALAGKLGGIKKFVPIVVVAGGALLTLFALLLKIGMTPNADTLAQASASQKDTFGIGLPPLILGVLILIVGCPRVRPGDPAVRRPRWRRRRAGRAAGLRRTAEPGRFRWPAAVGRVRPAGAARSAGPAGPAGRVRAAAGWLRPAGAAAAGLRPASGYGQPGGPNPSSGGFPQPSSGGFPQPGSQPQQRRVVTASRASRRRATRSSRVSRRRAGASRRSSRAGTASRVSPVSRRSSSGELVHLSRAPESIRLRGTLHLQAE